MILLQKWNKGLIILDKETRKDTVKVILKVTFCKQRYVKPSLTPRFCKPCNFSLNIVFSGQIQFFFVRSAPDPQPVSLMQNISSSEEPLKLTFPRQNPVN